MGLEKWHSCYKHFLLFPDDLSCIFSVYMVTQDFLLLYSQCDHCLFFFLCRH